MTTSFLKHQILYDRKSKRERSREVISTTTLLYILTSVIIKAFLNRSYYRTKNICDTYIIVKVAGLR